MPRNRVLVIDDDASIRFVLREALIDEGYDVREAVDGQAGLDQLADWVPDVIVLDLMMPKMDGWAFRTQQRLSNRSVDVPIILLSATRRLGEKAAMGAAAILSKPFELDELLMTVAGLTEIHVPPETKSNNRHS